LKYHANILRFIRSKIGLKIGILVVVQIVFIINSFSILSYYESQGTYLGNSINIAGKNRFLTSNLMLQISEYFLERDSNSNNIAKTESAMNQVESNLLTLKQGGMISGVELKPLPSEFLHSWNTIYQKWVSLKTVISDNIIKSNKQINSTPATLTADKDIRTTAETRASSLVDSSNLLVTDLGEYARSSSQYSMFLQGFLAILNIAVTLIVLYLVMRIIKPIFALTVATSKVTRGNLDVSVKSRGEDELSVLTDSFNSMVKSLKNYIKKQNELTKELENANEELKHQDQLKDEFINVAAHELRTPIQPILGLSEVLQWVRARNSNSDTAMNRGEEEKLLEVIVRNSKRLQQLTDDILDVTKIESRSLFLKKVKFNLKEMILEVLTDYEQKIKNRNNITLSHKFQDKDGNIIEADRSRLCQVVNNLLSNAFKFTGEGNITVTVGRDISGSDIIVKIRDTGTGIHPDMLPKLFTKFATKSQTGGTGLGLFISKGIIERHGGRIWAENNNDGDKGATFAFSLPIKLIDKNDENY
jgi:signal transduction histidine kinase